MELGFVCPPHPGAAPTSKSQSKILDFGSMDRIDKTSAYPAPRVIHGESIQWTRAEEVLLLTLVQARQDLHQIGGRSWPLAAMMGGVILLVEIPHGVAPILERLHPSHKACGHDSNHG